MRKYKHLMKMRPVGVELSLSHPDGWTNRRDEAKNIFSQFCELAWKVRKIVDVQTYILLAFIQLII